MKRLLFIFLLICPLWVCTSCGDGWNWGWNDDDEDEDEDEEIVTGTNPEILIGKWENKDTFIDAICLLPCFGKDGYIWTTYEFRTDGGSITYLKYYIETEEYKEPAAYHFSNWLYSEEKETIYLNVNNSGTKYEKHLRIQELTYDSFREGSIDRYYYRVRD